MQTENYTTETVSLDPRLALAASYIPKGAVVADVGTDHAYLPIWLLQNGICTHAVASDINEGPLERARAHAGKYGTADRISFYRADGIAAIDLLAEGVTHIAVCGMGGELIAGILDAAPYTRRENVRCVLQPMSSVIDLRRYLYDAGYYIEDEKLAEAAGKIYICLLVRYDGEQRHPGIAELLLGEAHIRRGRDAGEIFAAYLRREYSAVQKKYNGRNAGNLDTSEEEELLRFMEKLARAEQITLI